MILVHNRVIILIDEDPAFHGINTPLLLKVRTNSTLRGLDHKVNEAVMQSIIDTALRAPYINVVIKIGV